MKKKLFIIFTILFTAILFSFLLYTNKANVGTPREHIETTSISIIKIRTLEQKDNLFDIVKSLEGIMDVTLDGSNMAVNIWFDKRKTNREALVEKLKVNELKSKKKEPEIFHLGLFNSLQTDEALHGILSAYSNNYDSNNEVVIVDSRPKESRGKWPRLFESLGIKISADEKQEPFLSMLHYLGELMKLGNGQDAWSSDKLKMISNQNNYLLKKGVIFINVLLRLKLRVIIL